MTHKILDHDTQKIIYRSAVRPKKSSTPNHRLAPHGGEVSASSDPSEDKISSGSPLGDPEGSSPEQKARTDFCRILGLTTLNSLLQYVNWLVWEVCSVN